MFHTRLTEIDLAGRAADLLSYAHYTNIRSWIEGQSLKGNFKEAITDTQEEGIEMIRAQLASNAVPPTSGGNASARYLRFRVEHEEIRDGLFWNTGGRGGSVWHYVDEKALTT